MYKYPSFLYREWVVELVHVYREANKCADKLASLSYQLGLGLSIFRDIPEQVLPYYNEDLTAFIWASAMQLLQCLALPSSPKKIPKFPYIWIMENDQRAEFCLMRNRQNGVSGRNERKKLTEMMG